MYTKLKEFNMDVHEIGRGLLGTMYECRWKTPRVSEAGPVYRKCAVKEVLYETCLRKRDPYEVNLINSDIKTHFRLYHENLVRFYDTILYAGRLFMFFEYVDGKSLPDILYNSDSVHPSDIERYKWCYEVNIALDYMHDNDFLHKDIKATNVMIKVIHNNVRVAMLKLCQHFMCHDLRDSNYFSVCRTPLYMAPELRAGKVELPYPRCNQKAKAADIYSLALLLNEILSQRRPFGEMNGNSSTWRKRDIFLVVTEITKNNRRPILANQFDRTIPDEMQSVICAAWNGNVRQRPTAKLIADVFRVALVMLQFS